MKYKHYKYQNTNKRNFARLLGGLDLRDGS